MSGDRPEDLKQRVDQLEATVRGLTQELVEANERIRLLEEQVEDGEVEPDSGSEANRPISPEDGGTNEEKPTDDAEEEADETEDDIIVA